MKDVLGYRFFMIDLGIVTLYRGVNGIRDDTKNGSCKIHALCRLLASEHGPNAPGSVNRAKKV